MFGKTFDLQFNGEHAVLLRASGEQVKKWIRWIDRVGPHAVLVFAGIFLKAVVSPEGLLVVGKEGVTRLGDMVMLVKPEWGNHVLIVQLLSARQKAWLHGVSFSVDHATPTTTQNMDERGRRVE